jgi:hypothetical protein
MPTKTGRRRGSAGAEEEDRRGGAAGEKNAHKARPGHGGRGGKSSLSAGRGRGFL